ncbi:hypothetical protein [Paenibacillus sedimenti]|uniref:Uncharacterized protein n=1 Tax=Paenibacillus sedimenti TaxID=2770274 RepID=A0A926KS12_9BACL|nr:hypothetical protein [Paenibacillus sedimenti]MBD0381218.1 hypothetical protein [Paenibacillus sedimenti]
MKKLQLLPLEAAIYEGFKAGKTYAQIKKETDDNRHNMTSRTNKLIEFGALIRTGGKRSFVYTVVPDIEYEIIQERRAQKELMIEVEDRLLDNLQVFELTEEQQQRLKENQHLGRTALAAKLGISKLQLNYVLDKKSTRPMNR